MTKQDFSAINYILGVFCKSFKKEDGTLGETTINSIVSDILCFGFNADEDLIHLPEAKFLADLGFDELSLLKFGLVLEDVFSSLEISSGIIELFQLDKQPNDVTIAEFLHFLEGKKLSYTPKKNPKNRKTFKKIKSN